MEPGHRPYVDPSTVPGDAGTEEWSETEAGRRKRTRSAGKRGARSSMPTRTASSMVRPPTSSSTTPTRSPTARTRTTERSRSRRLASDGLQDDARSGDGTRRRARHTVRVRRARAGSPVARSARGSPRPRSSGRGAPIGGRRHRAASRPQTHWRHCGRFDRIGARLALRRRAAHRQSPMLSSSRVISAE